MRRPTHPRSDSVLFPRTGWRPFRPGLVGVGLFVAVALLSGSAAAETDWHELTYLSGGGYWRARVRVVVQNRSGRDWAGEPVALTVGRQDGQVDVVGQPVSGVRVCDAAGQEVLFSVTDPDGRPRRSGPIPDGATLTVPVECPAGGSATYWVYFDNPKAWPVPDFLEASVGVRNGGVEAGEAGTPFGWRHDVGDRQHRTFWVTENPHSGRCCLKTVVEEGAEPTWISTRQTGIRIHGGARYVLRAWVKARNVHGFAGWYVHVGNRERPMLLALTVRAGGGTYDWKQIELRFTAPQDATLASLGTVLRGTGTAWFDDVELVCLDQWQYEVKASRPERLRLTKRTPPEKWFDPSPADDVVWDYRVPVRVRNLSNRSLSRVLLAVDLKPTLVVLTQSAERTERLLATARVVGPDGPVAHYNLRGLLLIDAQLPARSDQTYHVYLSSDRRAGSDQGGFAQLLASPLNLVRDASFEGSTEPAWQNNAVGRKPRGVTVSVEAGGKFGSRCSKVSLAPGHANGWFGWLQDVPVQPGTTYLYAGWVKSRDVAGRVQLHAHWKTASGQLCRSGAFTGAGPSLSGTRDWTLLSSFIQAPPDAAVLQLHLTTAATGTVWHDGVVLAAVVRGHAEAPQLRHESPGVAGPPTVGSMPRLTVWPVNPVVKVFRQTLPPKAAAAARVELARNEYEPLQLAVRSRQAVERVEVQVEPPRNSQGDVLDQFEVAVVGYVPIDYPTNYYRSEAPEWHRKHPTGGAGCDGWSDWWPDPLLPQATFSLKPNETQPVWVTFHAPKNVRAGRYEGRVRFVSDGRTLASVPVTVHVWNFTLPDSTRFRAIYDVRFTRGWPREQRPLTELYRQFWRFMARYRLCPDRVYPEPVFRYEGGRVTVDFTDFDRAASFYFDQLNLPHSYTPRLFYSFGWGHPPKRLFGVDPYEGSYPYEGADRAKLRPEYKRLYQQCLRLFWQHVKEKGWADRFVLYVSDEPHFRQPGIVEQMKAVCDMIHEVDPSIPIYSSTWKHVPAWDGYLNVWGIGHDGRVPVELQKQLRRQGARVWYTTDGQMCTDTPFCAIERLLPHYCFHYGAEAYEFWGINWLTYDPYRFGWHAYIRQSDRPGNVYWVRYPNGDGYLVYPGRRFGLNEPVPSIRVAQARDGVEDFEYLQLLRTAVERAKAKGRDVSAAERVLKEAAGLVPVPNAGGRYSTKILPNPEAVLQVRRRVAEAIERLELE